ncbi:hypothetical protein C0Q70_00676 [Pomacea canaliculata]|uniref:Uncharacterized protein n=1 Tax=Pomacea canaliculata TaxID=400727 RepID=A0A2T7PXB0_POMCA|nr:hypothetical protein C0Q70_00676 [Pomacea canaliculata]
MEADEHGDINHPGQAKRQLQSKDLPDTTFEVSKSGGHHQGEQTCFGDGKASQRFKGITLKTTGNLKDRKHPALYSTQAAVQSSKTTLEVELIHKKCLTTSIAGPPTVFAFIVKTA